MKNLSMKTLITFSIALMGLFGIVRAEEVVTETTQPVVSVTGELSTDIPLVTLLHLLVHILD